MTRRADDGDAELVNLGDLLERMRSEHAEQAQAAADAGAWGDSEDASFGGIVDDERVLLSGLMAARGGADAREAVGDAGLKPKHFYRAAHGLIFEAMLEVEGAGDPVDVFTIVDKLRAKSHLEGVGGAIAVSQIEAQIGTAAHCGAYARIVIDAHHKRSVRSAGIEIAARAAAGGSGADCVAFAQQLTQDLVDDDVNVNVWSGAPWIAAFTDRLEKLYNGEIEPGLKTGLNDLDKILGGFCDDDLIIIAARPSMGKTSFGTTLNDQFCYQQKKHVAYFSLEMPQHQVAARQTAIRARVDLSRLMSGSIQRHEWANLAGAMGDMSKCDGLTVIDSHAVSLATIQTHARRLHARGRLDCVIVDQLTAMDFPAASGANKADAVGDVTKGLKNLARELHVPVVALAQLNRGVESRTDKRPLMSDLRDSGAIEQDADKIIFLYRDEYYSKDKCAEENIGIAEAIVAKNRNGAIGTAYLRFQKELAHFSNQAKNDPAAGY